MGLSSLLVACGVLAAVEANTVVSNHVPGTAGRVVLLHGLARSASSLAKMQEALQADGYEVCNIEYPSREHTIEILAAEFVAPAIAKCFAQSPVEPIHFITHSMGGIIVRQLAATKAVEKIGRVVMLSPPNHGSEVVDKLGDFKIFDWLNGPAGKEIGTRVDSTPLRLGPATFEVGIITGVRSMNPFLSMMIPGKDDGKVGVDNAKLEGMKDFLVLRCSHPMIMKSPHAIDQAVFFLHHGAFLHATKSAGPDNASLTEPEQPGDCWE
jgi:pimeloyl-ACP methyl ester carboxylesterase